MLNIDPPEAALARVEEVITSWREYPQRTIAEQALASAHPFIVAQVQAQFADRLSRLAETFEAESVTCQERAANATPDAGGDDTGAWYAETGAADAWQKAADDLRVLLAAIAAPA